MAGLNFQENQMRAAMFEFAGLTIGFRLIRQSLQTRTAYRM
jgi:hypothetical protein